MNRKKIFSMSLSATLVISLLSGCGAKKSVHNR